MNAIGPASAAVLPYAGVLIAAIVEGEIAYIAAATLVAQGRLNAAAVLICGALGAAIGDQAFFYAFHRRLPRWLARYPSLERQARPLVRRVRRHGPLMVLLVRFTPGLRIAITAACAWAEVPPRQFSLLNLVSAFAWAVVVMAVVAWLGPACATYVGLGGWKGALIVGAVMFAALKAIGAYERRSMQES